MPSICKLKSQTINIIITLQLQTLMLKTSHSTQQNVPVLLANIMLSVQQFWKQIWIGLGDHWCNYVGQSFVFDQIFCQHFVGCNQQNTPSQVSHLFCQVRLPTFSGFWPETPLLQGPLIPFSIRWTTTFQMLLLLLNMSITQISLCCRQFTWSERDQNLYTYTIL